MGRRKNELIAMQYACGKCGSPLFCIVDDQKSDCINCIWKHKCPEDVMFIYDESSLAICCLVEEAIQRIRELIE